MSAYYNEHDPLKAEVLREAIRDGAIAPGDVDERSITDVQPDELVGYTQCHFFAGGGFWSVALRLAGWPDDEPVWTGSCPCPSFSCAGKGGGFDDPRHLWPDWARLLRERRPAAVFGEQSDDAVGYGWVDLVQTDLEAAAYAFGKVVFGAHSVGAPHIRQRLYFVADTAGSGWDRGRAGQAGRESGSLQQSERPRDAGELGNPGRSGLQERVTAAGHLRSADGSPAGPAVERGGDAGELAHADGGHPGAEGVQRGGQHGQFAPEGRDRTLGGFWANAEWIPCRNPKVPAGIEWRPIEPGTFPLAHGYPNRVGLLRLAGDAIVVEQAAAFIRAYREARTGF